MHEFNVVVFSVAALALLLGAFYRPLQHAWVSRPMIAVAVGVALGPYGTGVVDLSNWPHAMSLLEQAARMTLAVGLMAIALRLPRRFIQRNKRSLAVLLLVVMPLMNLAAGGLAMITLGLAWPLALLLGAVVSPTDPVVASSIVTGEFAEKHIPEPTRATLSAEAASNDGLAYPLVMLWLALLPPVAAGFMQDWLLRVVLWEVGAAVVFGVGLGYAAVWLLRMTEARGYIGKLSHLSFTVALSFVALAGAKLLGTDGILAVFGAGVTLARKVDLQERRNEERIQETFNQFFMLPVFTVFGVMLPMAAWGRELGALLLLAVAVLALRRLPLVWGLRRVIPALAEPKAALFCGWFGPIGVAAIFYATLMVRETGDDSLWTYASFLVFASVWVHGLTAAPWTKAYPQRAQ